MIDFSSPLESDRYSLTQTQTSDFDALYQVANDPLLWEQHPEQDRWKKHVFAKFFEAAIDNDLGCFTITDKERNCVVGTSRYYGFDKTDKAVRIGFTFISRINWGTTANTEIKKLMLDHAFQLVDKVYFDIGHKNYRSRKATEKLGATLVVDSDHGNVVYLLAKSVYYGQ